MDYQKHYSLLIAKARDRSKPPGYTENHHIVPRCMGGSDDQSNLVPLTAREHYLAHWMLAKIHNTKYSWMTVQYMRRYARVSRMISAARENAARLQTGELNHMYGKPTAVAQKIAVSKAMTGKVFSETHREKLRNANLGKKASAETRALFSRQRKGVPLPEHQRKAIGDGNRGKVTSEETRYKMSISMTPEHRSEATKKGWETRRARA